MLQGILPLFSFLVEVFTNLVYNRQFSTAPKSMKASISSVASSVPVSRWRTTTDNVVSDPCRSFALILALSCLCTLKRARGTTIHEHVF